MKRRNFILCSALFWVSGCSATVFHQRDAVTQPSGSSLKKPEKLRFAVSDVKGMEDLKKDYEALRGVLEQALSTHIEFFPVDGYIAAASALQHGRVDLVFTGPSEYVVMRARTDAVPVVAIKRAKYYPVIAVTANSGIRSVKDLKGKTIAMWEVGSTSGHLGPTKLLIDAGLDPKIDVTIRLMGKKGLAALQSGQVDAWAGSVNRYDKFLTTQNLTKNDLPLLVKGADLPADPFVVSGKLEAGFVAEIQKQLLHNQDRILQAIAPADGAKFMGASMVEVQDMNYDMIREVYRAVGQGSFLQG